MSDYHIKIENRKVGTIEVKTPDEKQARKLIDDIIEKLTYRGDINNKKLASM